MDKRLLLAITLSAIVVIAYQEYLRIYYPQKPRPVIAPTPLPSATPSAPTATGEIPATADEQAGAAPPVADVRLETATFSADLSSRGARLVSLRLKNYRATIDPASPPLELVSPGAELPLGVTLRGQEAWSDRGLAYAPSVSSLELVGAESESITFRGALPGGGEIEKRFVFRSDRHDFTVEVRVKDPTQRFSEVALGWVRTATANHSKYHFEGVEALVGKKILHFEADELLQGVIVPDPRSQAPSTGPVQWAGYADTYFLSAVAPRENDPARLWVKQQASGSVVTEILVPIGAAGGEPYPFVVYAGPKDLGILAGAGHHLERTVDLGWFSFVAEPMLRALKIFHRATGNYGIDIILLTILVKVLFIPLTQKSYKSMQELQKLQPQMKKLQERYKDDQATLNKEIMELYRRHKVNPLGGCLPMLLQMPIFIGLYNALLSAVELRHAPFALWINDLSAPDRLPALPRPPFGELAGYEIRIPVLTLFMGASMLVQQKMTPAAGDPMQQRMMMLMPLVFTVMFINFPSGLVLYWLVNNILTIAQQAMMQRTSK